MSEEGYLTNRQHEIDKGAIGQGFISTSSGLKVSLNNRPIQDNTNSDGYVYLLIDCSGSMRKYEKLEQAKKRSIDFANEARARGYLIGLIKFDGHGAVLCKPQREISVLKEQLNKLIAGDRTNMGDGIRVATQNLIDLRGSRYMVIVTDGRPDSKKNALTRASEAKSVGIGIIAIGTDDADEAFLQQIASRTELAQKVTREQLGQAIADAAKMLPAPRNQ